MFKNKRKTIGVFISQVHQEYQQIVCKGMSTRAKELGYNVAFFSNFLGYGEVQYELGERNIAQLPWYEDLDGIIVLSDTTLVRNSYEQVWSLIRQYANCPVVSVRQKAENYYNVLVDDSIILDEVMRHFIEDHGYRKINFLTGPADNPASIKRLGAYRRIMEEHQLPVTEEQIYYGDFWNVMGYDAVRLWLSKPETTPEAIVCANDYMAITVCNALAERGLSVPKDIAVSGCDNMAVAEDYNPSITTAGVPMFEMGVEAVNKIDLHNQGITQVKDCYLPSETTIRESCGCSRVGSSQVFSLRRNAIIKSLEAADKATYNNAFMSVELTNTKTVDDLDRKLASYTYMNEGFASFYMCLYKNWEELGEEAPPVTNRKEDMIMEAGISNGTWLKRCEFSGRDLIPSCYTGEEPQVFFFNMLHYQEICYGYTAISFYDNKAYQASYQGWLINICNALENIRIHYILNKLVSKLEDMSIKDALTGLYNRRALAQLAQKYLEQCVREQNRLMVFSADMDKLKYINDNFGHASGDVAIKAVADALAYAARDDEICMRVSGDEFVVIGMDYDQKKMDEFILHFEEKLFDYNNTSNLPFKVYVSFGWSLVKPNAGSNIEDYLIISDSKLYQQKYQKESMRLKHRGELMEPEN